MSAGFRQSKGVLPWPVQQGVITSYFGRQPHPTIKSVEIVNNGIDIRTDHGSQVQAVYEGTVVGTQFIPGFDYMVILQHGEYYTVYSNLQEVKVRKGDKVRIRQSVGVVSTDRKTNTAEVHFELWREKTRLDPTDWVKRK
ncbi:MAG: peptidoglycan DD-metalloendopeptidase family protein [Saprospiraceae bacterium]